MSRKRSSAKKRSRLTPLAASVVVTVAMTPACGGAQQTTNPPTPVAENPPGPEHSHDGESHHGESHHGDGAENPPGPEETPTGETENPPGPEVEKPPPPDTSKNPNIHKRADGTCWEHFSMECPEGARCNPPPPREVKCPE